MDSPRRPPSLNWLRAFEAAARHGSFSAAARELHVSQSAVSQQIRLLEHHLHQALFHRSRTGIRLSNAGEVYLPVVADALERLAAGTREVFGPDPGATVMLRANVAFAVHWLAPRLGRFRAALPDVHLRVSCAVWLAEVDWQALDFDLRFGTGRWPGTRADRVTRDRLTPVLAPGAADQPATPDALRGPALLHVMGQEEEWSRWLAAAGARGVDARLGQAYDTAAMTLAVAASGAGVALGRPSLTAGMLREGVLAAPFEPRIPSAFDFWLVAPERRRHRPAAGAFREWILAEAHG